MAFALLAAVVGPAAAGAEVAAALAPGDMVQPLDAEGRDGVVKHVDYPKGSATVLLFFLSGCPTCHKMIPEWNKAFERKPKDLKVVGVIMDQEPPGFWGTMPISFPVVRSPGRAFLSSLNVNRAPLTLRVGAGGQVDDLALGIVDPIRLGQLFAPPQ